MDNNKPRAHYKVLKEYVLARITSGDWPVNSKIPSESELTREFGVSRMTVNRALRELSDLDVIDRVQGVGSFVSEGRSESTLFEVRSIRDEIESHGHVHTSEVVKLEELPCKAELALKLDLEAGQSVFHSIHIHKANDHPIQIEDRYVNPKAAPEYLRADWSNELAHDYLVRVAPLQRAEHICEAAIASDREQELLELKKNEPVLILTRRTWSNNLTASWVRLIYPGNRYRLKGSFKVGTR